MRVFWRIGSTVAALLTFAGSASATQSVTFQQIVAKAKVHVTATGPTTAVTPGSSAGITVSVSGNSAAVPTGSVAFSTTPSSGHGLSGTIALDKAGTANWSPNWPSGTYTVTAVYSGDRNYLGDDVTVPITVSGPDFKVTIPPPPDPIKPGDSYHANIDVSALDGFTGTVKFSCSGLAKGMGCFFNPATIKIGSGPQKTKLTITTNSAETLTALGGFVMMGLFGFGRKLRLNRLNGWIGAGACLVLVAGTAGCAANVHLTPGSTPPGTYQVVVTAESGTLSHSETLTIVVQ